MPEEAPPATAPPGQEAARSSAKRSLYGQCSEDPSAEAQEAVLNSKHINVGVGKEPDSARATGNEPAITAGADTLSSCIGMWQRMKR